MSGQCRHLILVLGDQLDHHSPAFDDFDAKLDVVWMVEVSAESEQVWSHQARIAIFLSAMRHFRKQLEGEGINVDYRQLDDSGNQGSFGAELQCAIRKHSPDKIIVVQPGEHRVLKELQESARACNRELEIRKDDHFLCSLKEFDEWAEGRKELRMEFFYREMRKKTGVLMQKNGKPAGDRWNFDEENRDTFGKKGPGEMPQPKSFEPDAVTREVMELVKRRFKKHPGRLDFFDWPVTREQALEALNDFIENRLPNFGRYQDAMWTPHHKGSSRRKEALIKKKTNNDGRTTKRDEATSAEPLTLALSPEERGDNTTYNAYLYHSRLSAALNLKLLNPREVIDAAEQAYREKQAPLAAVEGFIRQILGWREYVRGVYWRFMPEYLDRNVLEAKEDLPGFYWTGKTDMNCLRTAIGQTLEFGYAHHIQRLMVTGLFALLYGVHPRQVHEWYLAVYVDAVEWVELPNILGMSQYADGGVMASKPYVASGKYLQRMSNYCDGCRYDPAESTGDKACPFTTLYWDFLIRHQDDLKANRRMTMQLKNLDRKNSGERAAIRRQASQLKKQLKKT